MVGADLWGAKGRSSHGQDFKTYFSDILSKKIFACTNRLELIYFISITLSIDFD